MHGSLLQKGIGFYLEATDIIEGGELTEREKSITEMIGLNPGEAIGYAIGAAYVIWPVDIIPDWIPVIGYMDDLAVFRMSGAIGGLIYDIFDFIF